MVAITSPRTSGERKYKRILTVSLNRRRVSTIGKPSLSSLFSLLHKQNHRLELFGERTSVVSPTELCEKENFYRVLQSSSGRPANTQMESDLTFAQKLQAQEKLKSKQEDFFEPTKLFVGEEQVQKLGFAPRKCIRTVSMVTTVTMAPLVTTTVTMTKLPLVTMVTMAITPLRRGAAAIQ